MPPKKKWTDEDLIETIKTSSYMGQVCDKMNLGYGIIKKYIKLLNIDISHFETPRAHTQETKDKLSKLQKDNLKNNNTNRWAFANRGKASFAEDVFEQALIQLGISCTKQYIPPENDRLFTLDFALINEKIAFEVNGNQHYEDGKLKPYYQNRHEYFVDKGWVIHEIHYYECIKLDRAIKVIQNCTANINISYSSSPEIINWKLNNKNKSKIKKKLEKYKEHFSNYNELKSLIETNFSVAEEIIKKFSGKKLPRINQRKVERPTKDILEKLVWEKPTLQIAKDFGISDSAVGKWCRNYGIIKPTPGYWEKLKSNKK